jgi:RNA polymerase sigma-70 factor (ECF subfamily)
VQAALRRLSALSREVVMLRDVQGLSVREVATLLGVPTGTVKSRASRARVELAEEVLALGRERSQP